MSLTCVSYAQDRLLEKFGPFFPSSAVSHMWGKKKQEQTLLKDLIERQS